LTQNGHFRDVLPSQSLGVVLKKPNLTQPGIEQVQALADISRSPLCCHSNETRAPRLQIRPIVHN